MKHHLFILLFLSMGTYCLGQTQSDLLLGKWKAYKLEHFNSDRAIDEESTKHFWQMLEGRTLEFKTNGVVEISGYTNCSWYIKDGYLHIRYGKEGQWDKEKIMKLDETTLLLNDEVDFP